MILFQILALALLVPWAASVLYKAVRRGRRRNLLLFLVLASAIVAIVDPYLTQAVAHLLGIGRGADLVLYATSLFAVGCFFLILYIYRILRLQITDLTRQLALERLETDGGKSAAPPRTTTPSADAMPCVARTHD